MFSKLLNKILSNKRNILFVLVWISLFFVLSDSAFAVEQTNTFADTKKKVWEVVQFISTTLAVFLALISYLTTMFLSPEWVNGSLFWMNTVFKSIWIMVSNIVYLIFAFILIWIAFMNIIWKWTEKYALKQALPKFIVGILIVPFSWFLVNFILSISAILTISALNLPFDTFDSYKEKMQKVEVPTSCVFNPDNMSATWATDLSKILKCDKSWNKSIESLLSSDKSGDSIFGIIWLYTYWVINLESFDNLNEWYQKSVTNMAQLIIKIVFDFLFIVVYSVLMVALWLVLMTRWIYLWIYMMISPLFWLMYFFDKSEWWSGFFEKFNLKQFISLAFVPVFAMLALSFWLLFLYVVWNWMTTTDKTASAGIPTTINITKDSFKINEITLTLSWSVSTDQSITSFMQEIWNKWLWVIWSLILKIFGIVVLWWAVMAALRTNEITKAVVEPLYQFGSKVWELATKSPQYAPIFGGQSMESLSSAAWRVSSEFSSVQQRKWNKLAENFLPQNDVSKKYSDALTRVSHNAESAINNIRHLNPIWEAEDIAASWQAIEAYTKNLQKLNDEKKFTDPKKATELIEKLHKEWKSNPQIIKEVLRELDNISVNWYAILWWDSKTWNDSDVNSQLWKWASQQSQPVWTSNQTVNLNINWAPSQINVPQWVATDGIQWVIDNVKSKDDKNNFKSKASFITELAAELKKKNFQDPYATQIATQVADKIIWLT